MGVRTVADLKKYLAQTRLSPEVLGRQVNISNMTLRRLLKKPPRTLIPPRYRLALDFHQNSLQDMHSGQVHEGLNDYQLQPFLDQLELRGEGYENVEGLQETIKAKLTANLLRPLTNSAQVLLSALSTSKVKGRDRALTIGALLYFADPFDCIPDALLGIGYLDDYGVLSLVAGAMTTILFGASRKEIPPSESSLLSQQTAPSN